MIKNLIFLPGWSFRSAIWQRQGDYFSRFGYKVVLCDLEKLEECLKKIRLEESIFIAWSLGWFKLLSALRDVSYLPKAIIGVAGAVRFKKSLMRLILRHFQRNPRQLLEKFNTWLFAPLSRNRMFNANGPCGFNEYRDFILQNQMDDKEKLWQDLLFLQRINLSNYLGNLNIPVLLISGRGDAICPWDETVRLRRYLPKAQLEMLGTGHVPFLTKTDEFNRIVEQYIVKINLISLNPPFGNVKNFMKTSGKN